VSTVKAVHGRRQPAVAWGDDEHSRGSTAEDRDVVEIARALRLVGLEHLFDRLAEDAPWDQILSGGEKQRLAFARILLHRPNIVVC
jgi:ABC-type uncharacterized transport system fused permease/ATPase subunit